MKNISSIHDVFKSDEPFAFIYNAVNQPCVIVENETECVALINVKSFAAYKQDFLQNDFYTLTADANYAFALLHTGEQIQSYIQTNKNMVLEQNLISKAIVTRMFYANRDSRDYNDKINRIKKPPLGDFFTESVALYTLAFLKNINGLEIVMEQQFMGKRPDILIKKHGHIEYVFEMKIDMGYSRKKWLKIYNEKVVDYGLPAERGFA
ncbi:hypothetical protein Elgi_68760 [Paenibacillus elgii]|nr:hypothetical protein Elgi_68760 [Paenibacillus elgii]